MARMNVTAREIVYTGYMSSSPTLCICSLGSPMYNQLASNLGIGWSHPEIIHLWSLGSISFAAFILMAEVEF